VPDTDQRQFLRTVELLREASRNHAAASAAMCSHPDRARPLDEEVEQLGELLRNIEDVALAAVCRLALRDDAEIALRALEEAQADWLREVILNRVAETILPEGPPG